MDVEVSMFNTVLTLILPAMSIFTGANAVELSLSGKEKNQL